MSNRWRVCLGIIVVAGLLHAADQKLQAPVIPTGERMDSRWSFQSLDGITRSLTDFDGRVLVVSHWATWCAPCTVELPALAHLYSEVKGHGVEVLCMTNENPIRVKAWLAEHPVDAPIYTYAGVPPEELKIRSWPTTYIINKRGYVIHREEGPAQWDDPGVVQKLLAMAR